MIEIEYNKNQSIKKLKLLLLKLYLNKIKKLIQFYGINCFFSYAWEDKITKQTPEQIEELKEYLECAGIDVKFDLIDDHQRLASDLVLFKQLILEVDYVILFCSNNLLNKLKSEEYYHIQDEVSCISERYIQEKTIRCQSNNSGNNTRIICLNLGSEKIVYNTKQNLSFEAYRKIEILREISNNFLTKYLKAKDFNNLTEILFELLLYFSPVAVNKGVEYIYKEFLSLIKEIVIKDYSYLHIENYLSCWDKLATKNVVLNISGYLQQQYLNAFSPEYVRVELEAKIIQAPLDIQCCRYDGTVVKDIVYPAINDLLENKLIIISGGFGMGKSILCKHITNLWAKSDPGLLDFKFVFFIEFSNIKESRYPCKNILENPYNEIDIIIKECFKGESYDLILPLLLKINIEHYKDQILWIIDGYNDLDENIPSYLSNILKNIIHSYYVILTKEEHQNNFVYYQLHGFNESAKQKYIKSFFYTQSLAVSINATRLLQFIDYNKIFLGHLTSIPLFLKYICNIWLDYIQDKHTLLDLNLTRLYQEIWLRIIARSFPEYSDAKYAQLSSLKFPILIIREIALNLYIIGSDEFEISTLNKLIKAVLLQYKFEINPKFMLDEILKMKILFKKQGRLKFIDHSLQVFLAAQSFTVDLQKSSCSFHNRLLENIVAKKYTDGGILLYMFVSGLLYNNSQEISTQASKVFWNSVFDGSDLVRFNEIYLGLKCLTETNYEEILKKYQSINFFIVTTIDYMVSYMLKLKLLKSNSYLGDINRLLLDFAKNCNIMNIIINIIDIGCLYRFIKFILLESESARNIMFNWILRLDLNSQRKIIYITKTINKKKYEEINSSKQLLEIAIDCNASRFFQIIKDFIVLHEIFDTEIIDIICGIIINLNDDATVNQKILSDIKRGDFIEFQHNCREVLLSNDLSYAYLNLVHQILNDDAILNQHLKIIKFGTENSLLKKNIDTMIYFNTLNQTSKEDSCCASFLGSYYGQSSDEIYVSSEDFGSDVFSEYDESDYDLSAAVEIDLAPKILDKELFELIEIFHVYNEENFGKIILKRLIFNCCQEKLQILDNKVVIYDKKHGATLESFEIANHNFREACIRLLNIFKRNYFTTPIFDSWNAGEGMQVNSSAVSNFCDYCESKQQKYNQELRQYLDYCLSLRENLNQNGSIASSSISDCMTTIEKPSSFLLINRSLNCFM